MKKVLVILVVAVAMVIGPSYALADNIHMIGMKRVGHGVLIIWHPDNTVSQYVMLVKNNITKLVKVKTLDIEEYPLPYQKICDK